MCNRTAPVQVTGVLVVTQPSFFPGSYVGYPPIVVRISEDTPGATIHYTTNGQDPSENDPTVASGGSITVNQSLSLKARAYKPGWVPSVISIENYTTLVQSNPIDDARNFVHQHYLDFLSREPDQSGWDYWTSQITQCGANAACIHNQRIGVSAAFFIELEFQQTGSVAYRLNRAAYGAIPGAPTRANVIYPQFITDRAQLVGGPGLPQSTIDLANNFVQRSQFKAAYPDAIPNADFVNTLFNKADLTAAANATLRQAAIDAMNNSGKTRAQGLLDVIEIQEF